MKTYIRTFSGKTVNPLRLRSEDIDIESIAHSLSLINRFVGHTKHAISVAQHSVYVSSLCTNAHRLQGLLHDGSEAYLGDVTKWLKHSPEMAAYRKAEARAQETIYKRFGCNRNTDTIVEQADRIMVRFEGMRGFGPEFKVDHPNYPPLTKLEIQRIGKWNPWSAKKAESVFLNNFYALYDDGDGL